MLFRGVQRAVTYCIVLQYAQSQGTSTHVFCFNGMPKFPQRVTISIGINYHSTLKKINKQGLFLSQNTLAMIFKAEDACFWGPCGQLWHNNLRSHITDQTSVVARTSLGKLCPTSLI